MNPTGFSIPPWVLAIAFMLVFGWAMVKLISMLIAGPPKLAVRQRGFEVTTKENNGDDVGRDRP